MINILSITLSIVSPIYYTGIVLFYFFENKHFLSLFLYGNAEQNIVTWANYVVFFFLKVDHAYIYVVYNLGNKAIETCPNNT